MSRFQTTEFDTENQFDWTSIQYTIEDDVIVATRTLFDAGYTVFGTYEDGVLTEELYVGTMDALGFDNRQIEYDAAGQITYRGTVFPDDYRVSEVFENGVRTETLIQDGFFGDGAETWREIAFTHDADGNIASRRTEFDDGRVELDMFEPGVRETVQDFEQTNPWESIDTTFDASGDVAERVTTLDTGIVRQEIFEDGARVRVVQTDNPGSDGPGAKKWTSIDTSYDADGNLHERVTINDNGVTRTETFEDGQRVSLLQEDLGDGKRWETITTEYDAGQMAERRVEFDNGDVSLSLYADGSRTQLVQLDGNDSANWLLRVTDFDAEGGRVVTTYAAAEDIPEDLLTYFPDLVPPVEKTEFVLDFDDDIIINDGDTVMDGEFVADIGIGQYDIQGVVRPIEYGGDTPDGDLEAFNSWGATVGFSRADGDEFDFASLSLANASRSDTTFIPEENWANTVTINGYYDGVLVNTIEIDLTFDHVTHDLGWEEIDRVELVASGGGITNDHLENAGWFSMDDLVFLV